MQRKRWIDATAHGGLRTGRSWGVRLDTTSQFSDGSRSTRGSVISARLPPFLSFVSHLSRRNDSSLSSLLYLLIVLCGASDDSVVVADIVAGVTLAVMVIPQGLGMSLPLAKRRFMLTNGAAYSSLAQVDPIVGLYTALVSSCAPCRVTCDVMRLHALASL